MFLAGRFCPRREFGDVVVELMCRFGVDACVAFVRFGLVRRPQTRQELNRLPGLIGGLRYGAGGRQY
jgi:hypothetical protein